MISNKLGLTQITENVGVELYIGIFERDVRGRMANILVSCALREHESFS